VIKCALLIFLGILTIALSFHTGTLVLVAAQSSIENSSNLTYPNNPTLTIGEMLNGTNMKEGNNSNESDNNLPSPM